MASTTSQLKPGLQFVVDAETDAPRMEPQHAGESDEAGQKFTHSKEQAGVDAESGSVAVQIDKDSEDVHGPKGIRFALLYTCLLVGCFFMGYVRADTS